MVCIYANFDLDQSVHVRTGAENVRKRDHFSKKVHNRPN
jgi:hypothetical protein